MKFRSDESNPDRKFGVHPELSIAFHHDQRTPSEAVPTINRHANIMFFFQVVQNSK
jgi:hypothetical protein